MVPIQRAVTYTALTPHSCLSQEESSHWHQHNTWGKFKGYWMHSMSQYCNYHCGDKTADHSCLHDQLLGLPDTSELDAPLLLTWSFRTISCPFCDRTTKTVHCTPEVANPWRDRKALWGQAIYFQPPSSQFPRWNICSFFHQGKT